MALAGPVGRSTWWTDHPVTGGTYIVTLRGMTSAFTPPAPEPDAPTQVVTPVAPKRRRGLLIGGVAVAAVVLMAAGAAIAVSLRGGPAAKSPAAAPAPVAVTTTSSTQTATAQQYASAISSAADSLRETDQQYKNDGCEVGSDALDCSLTALTLGVEATTLKVTLEGVSTPDGPAYIGDPPETIAQLVVDTKNAALSLVDAATTKPIDPVNLNGALTSMMSTLDRWNPYM